MNVNNVHNSNICPKSVKDLSLKYGLFFKEKPRRWKKRDGWFPVSESRGLTVTTDWDTGTEVSHCFLNFMISTCTAGPQWSFCSNKYWQIGLKKDITLNLLVSIAADQENSEFLHICKFNTWTDLNNAVRLVLLSCQELNCKERFN